MLDCQHRTAHTAGTVPPATHVVAFPLAQPGRWGVFLAETPAAAQYCLTCALEVQARYTRADERRRDGGRTHDD